MGKLTIKQKMYPQLVLWALLASVAVAAGGLRFDFIQGPVLTLGLGTPPQKIEFALDTLPSVSDNPRVYVTDRNFHDGNFDMKASSSFQKTGIINDTAYGGTKGTDVLTLGNGIKLEKQDVDVIKSMSFTRSRGRLSLVHMPNEGSVIQKALKTIGDDQTVVFAFKRTKGFFAAGSVFLGNANPPLCKTNWVNQRGLKYRNESWTIQIDEIIIGKYHLADPIPLGFTGDFIYLNDATFKSVIQQLGGTVGKDGWVRTDCDIKTELEFVSKSLHFILKPSDYILGSADSRNQCQLKILNSKDEINVLPLKALHQRCLRFDFTKAEVGIADYQN